MRGKVLLNLRGGQYFRITPAYAGKRLFNIMSTILYRDHPRLCGEKQQTTKTATISRGSPPPMRGKGDMMLSITINPRITPAYAGKRFGKAAISPYHRDHPRLCGEKPYFYDAVTQRVGSPPPMRGKVIACYLAGAVYGITPAYAGKRY